MILERPLPEMTDAELRDAALRLESLWRTTGEEEYLRLREQADTLLLERLLAQPNPYAEVKR